MSLSEDFLAYAGWRSRLTQCITRLRDWLGENDLSDAQIDLRLTRLLERLREDRLVVAFVAEFSRGKSELINALFFADYGNRIVPSAAGRTTMCPTEFLFDPARPPAIELLPIETRAAHTPVTELKRFPEEWVRYELDVRSTESMQASLRRVGEQKRVSEMEALALGFQIDQGNGHGLKLGPDELVDVPRWRHAIINFPHPLLQQGLVLLDTPGLNAIGAEPELTVSLLPSAHAVLFILAADTGVTQSDLEVWRNFVVPAVSGSRGRMVALNKIDGLWDGLRGEDQIDAEIERQVQTTAAILEVDADRVFPVSAQKGLAAKINGDLATLARARLTRLELALSSQLMPAKREIVSDTLLNETTDIVTRARELLSTRRVGTVDQLTELNELRGKNQSVIAYMLRKVKGEKEEFEQGLQRYYATRSVFSQLTNNLFGHLGLEGLRELVAKTRGSMEGAHFTMALRDSMLEFFRSVRGSLRASNEEITEISRMMDAMYKRFSVEHGLKLGAPKEFSLMRYEKEINRLERSFQAQFTSFLVLATTGKDALTERFFDTVAQQTKKIFESANRGVERWLRAVMAPLESQVREYQIQLKRRLESVKRIYQATDSLDERISELEQMDHAIATQMAELRALDLALRYALSATDHAGGPDAQSEARAA
ncbi:MAG: dynamin family protein [Rhodocyclaceae bacterium]|nr:dynamin family protein [Rhodocyclaceae bacterium]